MLKPSPRLPLFLLSALLGLPVAIGGPPPKKSVQKFKFVADTIHLNVLIVDRVKRGLVDLRKENLRVFEDKVEQEITNFFPASSPLSVALLVDTSSSTKSVLPRIQDAAIEFLNEIHPGDDVMVISFDYGVYLQADSTYDKEELKRAIKNTETGSYTLLYDAVSLALRDRWGQSHRKVMVLFTDGWDWGSLISREESLDFAEEADVTIYTIFFDTFRKNGYGNFRASARSYLKKLAKVSGGRYFQVKKDLKNLRGIFSRIAAEMRGLYSVSYVSSNVRKDGKYRKIRVRVDQSRARVRTRQGYYARKSSR